MKFIFFVLAALFTQLLFGQTPIEVTESTIKIHTAGEKSFYFGFAEGDQVIFNCEEINGKELNEVEIVEMSSTSKFKEYNTKSIKNKRFTIPKTAIYQFRFSNTAIGARICKYKIERIPSSEATKNFNTAVFWKTVNDTYYTTHQERTLIKTDTTISNLTDQVAKVHSTTNRGGNETILNFSLPEKTVSWSYYIGVDQSGQEAYEKATRNLASKAGPILSRIPGYGPMAALALGGASFLTVAQSGEDIDFYLLHGDNGKLYQAGKKFSYIKKGKIINDFSRMTDVQKGQYYVCLSNDNALIGVTVAVKITAVLISEKWDTIPIQKMHITSRQEAYLKN